MGRKSKDQKMKSYHDTIIRPIMAGTYALISKCILRAAGTAIVGIVIAAPAFSQAPDPLEALLSDRARLMKSDCDLDCSRKVAAMYSEEFLKRNKESLIVTLSTSTNRASDAHILFGKVIEQSVLEQMSPIDVFAHQLAHMTQSIPPEYRYAKTEILSKKTISANEVLIIVRNHGLPGAPDREDEESIHLIKEGGKWKFRN